MVSNSVLTVCFKAQRRLSERYNDKKHQKERRKRYKAIVNESHARAIPCWQAAIRPGGGARYEWREELPEGVNWVPQTKGGTTACLCEVREGVLRREEPRYEVTEGTAPHITSVFRTWLLYFRWHGTSIKSTVFPHKTVFYQNWAHPTVLTHGWRP